jgi:hypothetical protein
LANPLEYVVVRLLAFPCHVALLPTTQPVLPNRVVGNCRLGRAFLQAFCCSVVESFTLSIIQLFGGIAQLLAGAFRVPGGRVQVLVTEQLS